MTKNAKVALAAVVVIVLVVALVLFPFGKGNATGSDTCVPTPATTQTVVITPEVPAVPGTPGTPAVTQEVTTYQHYSHAHNEGDDPLPNDGVPPTPEQDPTQWQANADKEPTGHYGHMYQPDGSLYEEGEAGLHYASHGSSGRRDWFYLGATTTTVVITPEVPATPGTPAIPAVTQQVVTPAVTCDTPSETPTVTPTTPNENPQGPETPVSNPQPPKPPKTTPAPPKDVQVIECVDGVWVTTVNGEVISESGTCERDETNNTPQTFSETGL